MVGASAAAAGVAVGGEPKAGRERVAQLVAELRGVVQLYKNAISALLPLREPLCCAYQALTGGGRGVATPNDAAILLAQKELTRALVCRRETRRSMLKALQKGEELLEQLQGQDLGSREAEELVQEARQHGKDEKTYQSMKAYPQFGDVDGFVLTEEAIVLATVGLQVGAHLFCVAQWWTMGVCEGGDGGRAGAGNIEACCVFLLVLCLLSVGT